MTKKFLQFRIRTIAILVATIALFLAAWSWTSTIGITHLRERYFDELEENISADISASRIAITVDECLDEIDTSEYFQNPRSPFPFVINVETNYLYHNGEPLQTSPGNVQTHIWIFGFVSDAL